MQTPQRRRRSRIYCTRVPYPAIQYPYTWVQYPGTYRYYYYRYLGTLKFSNTPYPTRNTLPGSTYAFLLESTGVYDIVNYRGTAGIPRLPRVQYPVQNPQHDQKEKCVVVRCFFIRDSIPVSLHSRISSVPYPGIHPDSFIRKAPRHSCPRFAGKHKYRRLLSKSGPKGSLGATRIPSSATQSLGHPPVQTHVATRTPHRHRMTLPAAAHANAEGDHCRASCRALYVAHISTRKGRRQGRCP